MYAKRVETEFATAKPGESHDRLYPRRGGDYHCDMKPAQNTKCVVSRLSRLLLLAVGMACCSVTALADEDAAEQKAIKLNAAYLQRLKQQPAPGAALDKVYTFHLDRGTLDTLLEQLNESVTAADSDGSAALLVGLIEQRRGHFEAAQAAFETALQLRPNDATAARQLGQVLLSRKDNTAAAAALESALQLTTARRDQSEIYQQLGRLYQRMQQPEQALGLWKRFEGAFPNDALVQEKIAAIMVEEGQLAEALLRYQSLQATSNDPYKRIEFGTKAGELLLKLDRRKDGIDQFRQLLTQLKPGSWQADGIRDRIEEAFLKHNDQAGLIDYLQQQIDQRPDDLNAMARLASSLSATGDSAAAVEWLQRAVQKAPSDVKLRESLIAELTAEKQFAEAAAQYQQLAKIDSGNSQHLERWGRLLLSDSAVPEAERTAAAAEIWQRLLKQHPKDPLHVSHVAGLFRSAGMVEDAIALHESAIDLAPAEPQYVEYLGEYLHSLNRKQDAVRTFHLMAAGERRTTDNLSRLSKVLAEFGYDDEALTAMSAAVELSPQSADRIRFAELLRESGQYDDCLSQLELADAAVMTADERRQLQQEQILTYQAADILAPQIADRQRQLASETLSATTEQQWQFLALMQQAAGQLREAAKSLQQAVALNPESTESWSLAADIMQKAGLLADAADAHRQLAKMDRRSQVEHLQRVAELEHQLGRNAAALEAAQAVLMAAPGNPQANRFYAEMCFRLGQPEKALASLRQAVRSNPADREALQALAEVLADEFRTDEAIELYWRAFEKTEDVNVRISVIRSLTSLYLRTDQFEQLVLRLRSLAARSDGSRDILQSLSNAYHAAGNTSAAFATIEDLLQTHPRDRALLTEAVALAEQSKDTQAAIRYQRRLVQEAPSSEHTSRLANLLLASGDAQAAADLWANLPFGEDAADQLLSSVDQLLGRTLYDEAADLARQLLVRDASNWQAMLRLAFIEWKQGRHDIAMAHSERIVALSVPPIDSSAEWIPTKPDELPPPLQVEQFGTLLMKELAEQTVVPPSAKGAAASGPLPVPWPLIRYAEARSAAMKIQYQHHQLHGDSASFIGDLVARAGHDPQAAWDCYHAAPSSQTAALLQSIDTADAQLVYLFHQVTRGDKERSEIDTQKLVKAYQVVTAQHPEWLMPFRGVVQVIDTLKVAGDSAAAEQIQLSLRRKDASAAELYAAWQLAISERNVAEVLEVAGRLTAVDADTLKTLGWTFAELASARIQQDDWTAVERLLSEFLTIKAAAEQRLAGQRRPPADVDAFAATFSHRTFRDGRHTNSIRVTTMPPDARWSLADINFLVNIELLAGEQHWPRLLDTAQLFRQQATPDQALMGELAVAHLFVLHGDQNAAAVHVVRAAVLAPDDAELRLRLSRFYQSSGNDAEALALLDTIGAVDQTVMQQKETLALQLATSTGNPVRARQAAERLFGLRLDTETSIKLAAVMRTLDLNDMADAVLSRIRRASDNGIETLESLMQQYRQQGNADVATQMAQQILQETDTGARRSASAEAIRASAVSTLAEFGQLDSLIARTERQLQQAPESIELLQSLGEFYKAADRTQEAMAIAARLAEVQPDSVDYLLKLATQYEKVRNFSAACTHYLEVLKKDPQRFTQNYYQYLRTFNNARRLPELADVLLTVDLRKLNNNYYVVGETIEYLFAATSGNVQQRTEDPNQRKGLELLAAGWRAFPNERSYLLNKVQDPDVWRLPVMFDYAREGIIPATEQQAIARPWRGIAESPSFGKDGEITGTLTRVLQAIPDAVRLQQFTAEIQSAVTKFPDWHGGRLILSVLQAKRGDENAAAATLSSLITNPQIPFVPTQAAWLVGAELQLHGGKLLSLAAQMLQRSVDQEGLSVSDGYERSAGRRLAMLYRMLDRTKLAAKVIQHTIDAADRVAFVEPGRKSWQQIADLSAAGSDVSELGLPLDAIGLLQRITLPMLVASEQYRDEGTAHRRYQQSKSLKAALARRVSGAVVLEYLSRAGEVDRSAPSPVIDLLLTMPTEGESVDLRNSIVLASLHSAAKSDQAQQITDLLTQLSQQRLNDTSVAVAAFVFADAAGQNRLRDSAIQMALSADSTDVAPHDVALWLMAKPLLEREENQQSAGTLADRAESAAKSANLTPWLLAMLKERGELAVARQNLAAAEQAWSRMLDIVAPDIPAPGTQNSTATGAGTSAVREVREQLLNETLPAAN